MAVNVFRKNPSKFAIIVKGVKKVCSEKFTRSDGDIVDKVCDILKNSDELNQVSLNDNAI